MCAKQYTVALEIQSIAYKRYQAVMQILPGDEANQIAIATLLHTSLYSSKLYNMIDSCRSTHYFM